MRKRDVANKSAAGTSAPTPARAVRDAAAEQPAVPALGFRLREARLRQRLSLTDVAERAQLTKGFLSRLERGGINVSVAALMRLCGVLGINVSDLFEAPSGQLVRAADRQRIEFGGEGLTEYLLTPSRERRLQVLLTEIAPGGGSGDDLYALPTDVEFVHVLDGAVRVRTADEEVVLSTGDSWLFPARIAHCFHNASERTARVLWVLSPALSVEELRHAAG